MITSPLDEQLSLSKPHRTFVMNPLEEIQARMSELEKTVATQAEKIKKLEAKLSATFSRQMFPPLDGLGPDGKGSARPITDFIPK